MLTLCDGNTGLRRRTRRAAYEQVGRGQLESDGPGESSFKAGLSELPETAWGPKRAQEVPLKEVSLRSWDRLPVGRTSFVPPTVGATRTVSVKEIGTIALRRQHPRLFQEKPKAI
jgi:hypothetical protein